MVSVSAVTKVSSSLGFCSVLATRTRAVTVLAADKTEVRSESFMIVFVLRTELVLYKSERAVRRECCASLRKRSGCGLQ